MWQKNQILTEIFELIKIEIMNNTHLGGKIFNLSISKDIKMESYNSGT